MAKDIAGSMAKPLIRLTIPYPAAGAESAPPMALTIDTIKRKESPIRMLCNPMGIPILRYCHTRSQLIRKFGRANLNPNFPFHRKPSARNMLNACEMIVAYAAPRTPISNFATSSTSPTMLQRHATPTKISGATLLPKPRKIAASALYPMMNTTPQEQMEIYWIVSATASSGTCNAKTRSGASRTNPAVTNTLISREKLITMPIHRLVLRLSPAPK